MLKNKIEIELHCVSKGTKSITVVYGYRVIDKTGDLATWRYIKAVCRCKASTIAQTLINQIKDGMTLNFNISIEICIFIRGRCAIILPHPQRTSCLVDGVVYTSLIHNRTKSAPTNEPQKCLVLRISPLHLGRIASVTLIAAVIIKAFAVPRLMLQDITDIFMVMDMNNKEKKTGY